IYIYIYRAALSLLILCLSFTTFALINVLSSNSAFAEELTTNVYVKPSLRITLPVTTLVENLDPANNTFGSKDLTVSVATNNSNGYKLYLDSTNNTTNLVNTIDSTKYIETLSAEATESSFTANSWGYRISSGSTGDSTITSTTNYFPFVSGKLISSSPTPTNGVSSTLDFATKIDYNIPAGSYNIALNFKALPQVTQYYMQDFATDPTLSSTVCTTEPTVIMDSRDGSTYLIQRLKDGKCWMLDNLDLDLTNESIVANLTTENTNIDTTNDPNALDYLKNGGGTTSDKYATAGLELHNWTGAGMTPLSPNYSYSQPLVNRSGKCDSTKNSGFPCVGVWQNADYTHNTILNKADAANTIIKDNANNIGGPGSYKIGTYYNYCAATAGTYCYGNGASEGTTASGDATSDICPAGWHMPSVNGGTNGDYLTLCSAIKGSACTGTAWNTMSITDSTSMQYQLSTPLSGDYNSGTAYRQGTSGYFWSTTYYSGTEMRYLLVTSSGVYPQNNSTRVDGKSVRCVAS
ncbi:hypothetical protein IKF23_02900, partial [Candidatus Saccharibacteria bacterium]|nr:hypothetical protein [Candidatus Saccharibacteria bacterium]